MHVDIKELLTIMNDVVQNIKEDVPIEQRSKHLRMALDEAEGILETHDDEEREDGY